jgi:hypothetical protein
MYMERRGGMRRGGEGWDEAMRGAEMARRRGMWLEEARERERERGRKEVSEWVSERARVRLLLAGMRLEEARSETSGEIERRTPIRLAYLFLFFLNTAYARERRSGGRAGYYI